MSLTVLFKLIGLGNFPNYLVIGGALAGVGLAFGLVVAMHLRFMRIGTLEKSDEACK